MAKVQRPEDVWYGIAYEVPKLLPVHEQRQRVDGKIDRTRIAVHAGEPLFARPGTEEWKSITAQGRTPYER